MTLLGVPRDAKRRNAYCIGACCLSVYPWTSMVYRSVMFMPLSHKRSQLELLSILTANGKPDTLYVLAEALIAGGRYFWSEVKGRRLQPSIVYQREVRGWSKLDHDSFCTALLQSPLCRPECQPSTAEDYYDMYHCELMKLADSFAPVKRVTLRRQRMAP